MDNRSLCERLVDMAAAVDGRQSSLLIEAAEEIGRLLDRESEALDVIQTFAGPDHFNGWHAKYNSAISKAKNFITAHAEQSA